MTIRQDYAVVTGAGSGIGRAVALELSEEPVTVLAIGRRAAALEETARLARGHVVPLSVDVASEVDRNAVDAALGGGARVRYLVHGAGVQLIERVAALRPDPWRALMAINLDARLFLTQTLLSKLAGGGRVLFVGSRSAARPRKGAAAYCTAQAACWMLQECLKLELAERGIRVALAIPGGVDTPMLRQAMGADPDVFPDQAEYVTAARAGKLVAPAIVGRFYRWLLTRTDDERYSARPWDIRDETHHRHWLGTGSLYAVEGAA